MFISSIDLEALLRRPLTEIENAAVPMASEEARLLIESYTGGDYLDDEDLPEAVRVVATRMVARSMNGDPALEGVTQRSETTGPFNSSVTYQQAGTGMYLNKADKQMLSKLRRGFGSIKLANY